MVINHLQVLGWSSKWAARNFLWAIWAESRLVIIFVHGFSFALGLSFAFACERQTGDFQGRFPWDFQHAAISKTLAATIKKVIGTPWLLKLFKRKNQQFKFKPTVFWASQKIFHTLLEPRNFWENKGNTGPRMGKLLPHKETNNDVPACSSHVSHPRHSRP